MTNAIARDARTASTSPYPPRKVPREQIACLEVTTDHCPQVLLRVLGLVARHGAIPHGIHFERRPTILQIRVEIDTLAPAQLRTLNCRIEEIPTVRSSRIGDLGQDGTADQMPTGKLS